MRSFLKKIVNSSFGINVRNFVNFRPVSHKIFEKNFPVSVSDAFLWRTDNGYKTVFKYSDILNLFYKLKESWVEFHFYSKNNELLKIQKVSKLNLSNELEINASFMDGLEDYGIFYVFHFADKTNELNTNDIISNRCYLGYSRNNNLYSFVHGNIHGKFTNIFSKGEIFTDVVKTSLFQNQIYTIQKHFGDFERNEFVFVNPTSKTVRFSIRKKSYKLKPYCSFLLELKSSVVTIKSNCFFFRPTVFSYKGKYMDVHHS